MTNLSDQHGWQMPTACRVRLCGFRVLETARQTDNATKRQTREGKPKKKTKKNTHTHTQNIFKTSLTEHFSLRQTPAVLGKNGTNWRNCATQTKRPICPRDDLSLFQGRVLFGPGTGLVCPGRRPAENVHVTIVFKNCKKRDTQSGRGETQKKGKRGRLTSLERMEELLSLLLLGFFAPLRKGKTPTTSNKTRHTRHHPFLVCGSDRQASCRPPLPCQ